jgi:hypothetical protein
MSTDNFDVEKWTERRETKPTDPQDHGEGRDGDVGIRFLGGF